VCVQLVKLVKPHLLVALCSQLNSKRQQKAQKRLLIMIIKLFAVLPLILVFAFMLNIPITIGMKSLWIFFIIPYSPFVYIFCVHNKLRKVFWGRKMKILGMIPSLRIHAFNSTLHIHPTILWKDNGMLVKRFETSSYSFDKYYNAGKYFIISLL